MAKSAWNGEWLPADWTARPSHQKSQAIAHLQGRTLMPPFWWSKMSDEERKAVVLHLCAVGSVSYNHGRVRQIAGKEALYATMSAHRSKSSVTVDESTVFGSTRANPLPFKDRVHLSDIPVVERMLYPKPNGGKRILPSVYTKLKDTWLRANGQWQSPATINQGHLKNTVALLNESHINLVDRMTDILGRMHNHLGNRPDMQAKIVDLFHDLEVLQVDELYPIVELLASYIKPEVEFDPRDNDPNGWLAEF